MFCSGTEVRSNLDPSERRSTMAVASVGTVVPFAVAIALLGSWDFEALLGPAAHVGAFALVFGIALAVTSIPVISRIMMDLRVIETSFARVVLGAAIVEDILLYAVLSVALGLVGGVATVDSAVPALLGLEGNQGALVAYHGGVSVLFLALALWLGGRSLQALLAGPLGWLHRSSPAGALLAVLLATTGLAVGLGIAPMFGAFVAGLVVGRTRLLSATGLPAIREMSMAFFVPVYFAIVGLRIDLFGGFAVRGFLLFLAVACVAKAASVYAAARWAKEPHPTALNLAVAMNARGGPCIVLASVALDAQIISMQFYSYLILLALVTSSVAGSWLAHPTPRRPRPALIEPTFDQPADSSSASVARMRRPAGRGVAEDDAFLAGLEGDHVADEARPRGRRRAGPRSSRRWQSGLPRADRGRDLPCGGRAAPREERRGLPQRCLRPRRQGIFLAQGGGDLGGDDGRWRGRTGERGCRGAPGTIARRLGPCPRRRGRRGRRRGGAWRWRRGVPWRPGSATSRRSPARWACACSSGPSVSRREGTGGPDGRRSVPAGRGAGRRRCVATGSTRRDGRFRPSRGQDPR